MAQTEDIQKTARLRASAVGPGQGLSLCHVMYQGKDRKLHSEVCILYDDIEPGSPTKSRCSAVCSTTPLGLTQSVSPLYTNKGPVFIGLETWKTNQACIQSGQHLIS